jgi:hypothetical protein
MYKHIGKHNDKKILIVFREVPDEDHMCLVVYSDLLPRLYHDAVMKVLESDVGQQAKEFADALFRNFMPDGTNCLEALHRNGLLKKIPANQVLVTPTPTSSVRLDELNGILKEMSKGEEAVKRLAEIDSTKGLSTKPKKREAIKEVGVPPTSRTKEVATANEVTAKEVSAFLTDADLAQDRVRQATDMKSQAESLLKEVQRLLTEAADLDPSLKQDVKPTTTKKKTKVQAKEN